MKCPKCEYLGFDTAQRCRNCGYDFSLVGSALRPVAQAGDAGDATPQDLDLLPPPRAARRRAQPSASEEVDRGLGAGGAGVEMDDLPLFGDQALDGAGPIQAQPVPPPLAVRRAPAPTPRMRPRPAVRQEPEAAELEFVPETLARTADATEPDDARAAAPAGRRLAAAALDVALIAGIDAIVIYFTLRLCRLEFAEITILPVVPMAAFFALLNGGYLVTFTAMGGQTIGKMAARIKVIDMSGAGVAFGQATGRAVAYLASFLPAGLGFLPAIFSPGRRAVHDRLANTRVVSLTP